MRSTSSSLVLLAVLAALPIGCSWVSPDQCWRNSSAGFGGNGPIPIGAGVGATSGDFRSPGAHPLDVPAPYNPCVTQDTPGEGSAAAGGGDPLAGVDPHELATAEALGYTLTGLVNQRVDISSGDDAAAEAAMTDSASTAQTDAVDWLAQNDASQLSTDYEGYECTDKLKCPYKGTCSNKDPGKHLCIVDKCGSATCQSCPGNFKNWAGNLLFKSWCGYICREPVAYGKTVAVGVMGVTAWGTTLPLGGPYCFDP